MKIIFISSKSITFNTFLKSQANYLIKKGFKIEVATSDNNKLNFKKRLSHKINFPNKFTDFFNLVNYIKIYLQIKILVKKNPAAVFYLHTPLASHLFRFCNFFTKLRIIYFVHGFRFTSTSNSFKNFFFKIIEKILSFKTDIFITINNEDYNYAKFNMFKNTLCYKLNGVGLDLPNKRQKKKIFKNNKIKKILVIAAYKKEKGYLEVLKVAKLLKKRKIKLDCYGYGDQKKYKIIKNKKKIKNIFFKKFDINLKNIIKKYDILLHLSKREGLPVGVMQSLSTGLPVICYNIRGNNDLIKDEFNGYFIQSYKDVPNKIYYLNLNTDFYYRMSLNALKSIDQEFSRKNINLKIYNIIKNYFKY